MGGDRGWHLHRVQGSKASTGELTLGCITKLGNCNIIIKKNGSTEDDISTGYRVRIPPPALNKFLEEWEGKFVVWVSC